MDVPPNQTVYLNNLNDSVQKEDLRRTLYGLCSQFGPILDVVARKTKKTRGQAFVVFRDLSSATKAASTLNGFELYGKPVRVQYAKSKSFAVMKEQGTFKQYLNQKKREALAPAKPVSKAALTNGTAKHDKLAEMGGAIEAPVSNEVMPPNKILYCSNMPAATTKEMLEALFGEFEGLQEIREVAGRPGIAFVEFENDAQAGVAMGALSGFKLDPTHAMQVNYAKQ